MAIILEAAYSKKLGLPNYSSHSYVVSIRTELNDLSQVAEESSKLYRMLQEAVDIEIQEVGFMPDASKYGMNNGNGANGHTNGSSANGHSLNGNGNGRSNGNGHHSDSGISDKQLDLINRVVKDNNLNKGEVEQMAVDMFGGGVRTLNKMQASNFIDELFERYPRKNSATNGNGNGNGNGRYQRQASRV